MTSGRRREKQNKNNRKKYSWGSGVVLHNILYYTNAFLSRLAEKISGKVLEVHAYTWKFMATANFYVVILIGSFRPVKIQYGARKYTHKHTHIYIYK